MAAKHTSSKTSSSATGAMKSLSKGSQSLSQGQRGGKAASAQPAAGMTPTLTKAEDTNAAPMTPKNFRNHPDMENFFRFIYENDLRVEALHIIDEIIATRQARRASKKGGASAIASAN